MDTFIYIGIAVVVGIVIFILPNWIRYKMVNGEIKQIKKQIHEVAEMLDKETKRK